MARDLSILSERFQKVEHVGHFSRGRLRSFGLRFGLRDGVEQATDVLAAVGEEAKPVGRVELLQDGDDADDEGVKVKGELFLLSDGEHCIQLGVEGELWDLGDDEDKGQQRDELDGLGCDVDLAQGVGESAGLEIGVEIGEQRILVLGVGFGLWGAVVHLDVVEEGVVEGG